MQIQLKLPQKLSKLEAVVRIINKHKNRNTQKYTKTQKMKININPLRAGAWLFFTIIIGYMLILKLTPANYSVNINNALSDTTFDFITLYDFKNSIESEKSTIIDISPKENFEKHHIDHALHYPFESILDSKELRTLKNKKVFLYGDDENKSYQIAYLLMQMGIDVLPIAGDYSLIHSYLKNSDSKSSFSFYHAEKAKYNYSIYFKSGKTEATKPKSFTMPDAKTLASKGGC